MLAEQILSRFTFTRELETDTRLIGEATLALNRKLFADSLFPRVSALMSLPEYRTAILAALRPVADKYRSFEDVLICELIPGYKLACEAFYQDAGGRISEIATPDELHQCERVLLCALALSKELYLVIYPYFDEQKIDTEAFIETVRRSFALQGFPNFSTAAQ